MCEMQINWDSFKVYNQDSRGIHLKFEDLCRQLFVNENISGNKQFRYLHANPNNAGLETEPIYDEANKRWVGFQAKYFDESVQYMQIEHSAQKTVAHYGGKVNHVFLYCNKPLTRYSLVKTEGILKNANITMELVTDNAILDLVRSKYPYLGAYYFGNHTLQAEWFVSHVAHMFDVLGERYNRDFNVETECSIELSLFLHDQTAVDYINSKKVDLIKTIESKYWKAGRDRRFLSALRNAVEALDDVDAETLNKSLEWFSATETAVKSYLDEYKEKCKELEEARDKAYIQSYTSKSKDDREAARRDYQELERNISELKALMEMPYGVEITNREQQLLRCNIMNLYGSPGTGKSHLLAYKTDALLSENRVALLLLAGIYYSESPIQEQIMSNLRLDYSFEDLIDILETIGERDNRIIPIFVDALNETWYINLWKNGLPLIIEKIKRAPMVKLVFTYRPEYEKLLLLDSIRETIDKGDVVSMHHRGFQKNSGNAVREFLNHSNIPFTPLEFFSSEMTNPLFLTLYCKTYNGEEVSFPQVYERLIEKVNENVFHTLKLSSKEGFYDEADILWPLISQMAAKMINDERRGITKEDLMNLRYWTDYGFVPAQFIRQLVKEELLHEYVFDSKEYYRFAYDQMNDYYCAKAILDTHTDKSDVREYLKNYVLNVEDGKIKNYGNIDLFVNVCALYAEKFGEECVDLIDVLNDDDKWEVFSKYIRSFQWRDPQHISSSLLYELLKKYSCEPNDLWPMLIGNSIKVNHPLNAKFLHEFLSKYALNKRDRLWTIYLNELPRDDENRIVQLIKMYDRGEKLEGASEKQIYLLLTLFGWILTSSNRWLRDYTSKAMIEILKEHFQLCLPLLEKFMDVNDPYVIQRLYGVVFGACCKRVEGDLQPIAEYVFETIFNQEKVYPDVLLRDYARLIIERFLWETSAYDGIINRQKIMPPYNSDPIPDLEYQHYEDGDYEGALHKLVMSMRIEKMGGYGDFGRYVFQSTLSNFDVDLNRMFDYAVYHIVNDLGFSEEYFGEHDRYCVTYDRHLTAKTERIGKKYQWITLYNMLARVADHCKMEDCWNYPPKEEVHFEGAWNPYVRDFDPTLNKSFMSSSDAPIFKVLEEHKANDMEKSKAADISDVDIQKEWLKEFGVFFSELKNTLLLTDDSGIKWVCLTKYCDTGRKDLNVEKLLVWSWLFAYFVTPEQEDEFFNCAGKGLSVITSETRSHHETYKVFNREYPWSPSCRGFEEYAWINSEIKTGEFETVTEIIRDPDVFSLDSLLKKYGFGDEDSDKADTGVVADDIDDDIFDVSDVRYKEVKRKREIKKDIGKILHATTDLIWEEEYDATKEDAISYSLPCAKLIEEMELKQLAADGFFYDAAGKLAAFDTNLTQQVNSVVVRKDILDSFLAKTDMKLIWLVDAEKEIHSSDYSIAAWSDWEAVFGYDGQKITGDFKLLRLNI